MIDTPKSVDDLETWLARRYPDGVFAVVDSGLQTRTAIKLRELVTRLARSSKDNAGRAVDILIHGNGYANPWKIPLRDLAIALYRLRPNGVYIIYEQTYNTMRIFGRSDLLYRLCLTPFLLCCWGLIVYGVVLPLAALCWPFATLLSGYKREKWRRQKGVL